MSGTATFGSARGGYFYSVYPTEAGFALHAPLALVAPPPCALLAPLPGWLNQTQRRIGHSVGCFQAATAKNKTKKDGGTTRPGYTSPKLW